MTVYERLCETQSRACTISEDNCKQTFARFEYGEPARESMSRVCLDQAIRWAKDAAALSVVIDALPVEVAEMEV